MKLSLLAAMPCFMAPVRAFVIPLGSLTKISQPPLFSTRDDASTNKAASGAKTSPPGDDDWLEEQLNSLGLVMPPELVEDDENREDDWVIAAHDENSEALADLKKMRETKATATFVPKSVYHGLLPDVPPSAPPFGSLENYCLDPVVPSKPSAETGTRVATRREHDWFSDAILQGPNKSLDGVQSLKKKKQKESWYPFGESGNAGILPDTPPKAPTLGPLQNYCLEPVRPIVTMASTVRIGREPVEWFSQSNASCKAPDYQDVVHHNQVKSGNSDWFMQALNN